MVCADATGADLSVANVWYQGDDRDNKITEANARLIAAAPEMLACLTEMAASMTAAIECGVLALDPNDESDAEWGARLGRARALLARIERSH